MIEGLLKRVIDELDDRPSVVATGGFTNLLASEIKEINFVDVDLTLEGLNLLYK